MSIGGDLSADFEVFFKAYLENFQPAMGAEKGHGL
tara:strand:- start:61 stop:165 length:105 start_codon:yes stop_codon:yes gene_type:complete